MFSIFTEFLKKIIDYEQDKETPRSVFVFFSHGNQDGWKNTLCFGDINEIVKKLNTFILDNTVTGLILSGIGNPVSCVSTRVIVYRYQLNVSS